MHIKKTFFVNNFVHKNLFRMYLNKKKEPFLYSDMTNKVHLFALLKELRDLVNGYESELIPKKKLREDFDKLERKFFPKDKYIQKDLFE